MKKILNAMMVVGMIALAANGLAQEATEASNSLAPVVEGLNQAAQNTPLTGEGIEAWFFSFLERLLNLFSQFIAQILQQVFAGVSGLLTGTGSTTSV